MRGCVKEEEFMAAMHSMYHGGAASGCTHMEVWLVGVCIQRIGKWMHT